MRESIETMLSQLREQKELLDALITGAPNDTIFQHRLCEAWDGIAEAIIRLEGALSWHQ